MRVRTFLGVVAGLFIVAAVVPLGLTQPARALSPNIVISQLYGGGGNSGAPYANKFVELFNRGGSAANLGGWSIQYASATGTGNFSGNPVVALPDVSVLPGGYFLVGLSGGANGAPLPTPDTTGTINPATSAGKIVLASTASGLSCNGGSAPCSAAQLAEIVDLVGYGTSNFYEGADPAPALSTATAALRTDFGCSDTDENAADFIAAPPAPRNSRSPLHPCAGSEPTASPTADPTASPTAEPTADPTASPTDDPTPSPEPTPGPTPHQSPFAFAFAGFASPLLNPPAVNEAKAGSAVPLKFSLGGDFGLAVISPGFPSSRPHSCTAEQAGETLDPAAAPGGSGLSYDPATDLYTFVWKTDRTWAGQCRELVLELTDGSRHMAELQFR